MDRASYLGVPVLDGVFGGTIMDGTLEQRLTYTTKCGHCGGRETYTLRDTNVNTEITDDAAMRIAMTRVGSSEHGYCEHCERITLHTITCYNLPVQKTSTLAKQFKRGK